MDTLAGAKRGKKKTDKDKEDDQAVGRTIRMLEVEARMRRNPNRTVLQREINRRSRAHVLRVENLAEQLPITGRAHSTWQPPLPDTHQPPDPSELQGGRGQ